jgi:hypothetical protein
MFDYSPNPTNPAPKSAFEIDLRAREQARNQALLSASYRKEAQAGARRPRRGLRALLTSLLSFL